MKKGQLVRHRNIPDEILRIKSISETVATVERINEPMYPSKHPDHPGKMIYPTYVCLIDNLYPDK